MLTALRLLAVLALGLAALLAFGPRIGVPAPAPFEAAGLADDPEGWLAARESLFEDITPGTQKRIVWAGDAGARTPLALVYLHGFSATGREIAPVPEEVAARLGANLYVARLAGHGRDGAALGQASAADWMIDLAEALALGRVLGERVVLIGTSTGASLAVMAATEPDLAGGIAGLVLVSPNFRQRHPAARLLTLPFAPRVLPLIFGEERGFTPLNEAQARYWTTRYPVAVLFEMAALARAAARAPHGAAGMPALFYLDPADRVVDHDASRKVAAAWGGGAHVHAVATAAGDDPFAHVIAGDILSPAGTAPAVETIAGWIAEVAAR